MISRSTDPVGRLGGVPLQVAIAKTLKLSCQLSCFVDPSRMHARTTVTWSVCGGLSVVPPIQRGTNNGAGALGPFFILVD